MSLHAKISVNTWKTILQPYVKISSTVWKRAYGVWNKVSGVWKQAFSSIPNTMVVLRGSSSGVPASWQLCNGTGGTPNLDNVFLGASYTTIDSSAQFGPNTHITGPSTAFTTGTSDTGACTSIHGNDVSWYPPWEGTFQARYDYHTIDAHTHSTTGADTIEPLYTTFLPYRAAGGYIASGTYLLYRGLSSAVPSPYSAVSTWNGRFIKLSISSHVTGGYSTHSHSASSPSHGVGNWLYNHIQYDAYLQPIVDRQRWNENHSHSTSHGNDAITNNPSHYTLMLIQASSDAYFIPTNTIGFFTTTTIPNGWALCDGTNGSPGYSNVLFKMITFTSVVDTSAYGASTHSDSSVSSSTGAIAPPYVDNYAMGYNPNGNNAGCGSHSHTMGAHGHGSSNNSMPYTMRLRPCIKL
jgi:hypothetical protein